MTKQEMIAKEIAKDVTKYLGMPVTKVQHLIGKELSGEFKKKGWNNNDLVVYSTLMCMAKEMRRIENG